MKNDVQIKYPGTEALPGLNCGICGYKTCDLFFAGIQAGTDEPGKCIHLKETRESNNPKQFSSGLSPKDIWLDNLDREYDFVIDAFEHEPGPRETILPYNPFIARKFKLKEGDIIFGRPMGMSCGCPVTHCGKVMKADYRNGVIDWCVTGPIMARTGESKDIGYYVAQGYEGVVRETRKELTIGRRYWFLPRRCMLQWRHSGLINFLVRSADGYRIRIEGLYIG